ncbi:MAG: hypothetical protein GY804_13105 [Alphaproteobacteria bacterium]|nr:hypothetical protein [Alphaproteobacteria bacterium]
MSKYEIKTEWFFIPFVISGLIFALSSFLSLRLGVEPITTITIPAILFCLSFVYAALTKHKDKSKSLALKIQPFALILAIIEFASSGGIALSALIHIVLVFLSLIICERKYLTTIRKSNGKGANKSAHKTFLFIFLLSSVTGALFGFLFVRLAAPFTFKDLLEYPLMIAFALMLRPASEDKRTKKQLSDEGIKNNIRLYRRVTVIIENTINAFYVLSAKIQNHSNDNSAPSQNTKYKTLATINDITVPIASFLIMLLIWKMLKYAATPETFSDYKFGFIALLAGLTYQFQYIPIRFAIAAFIVFVFAGSMSPAGEETIFKTREKSIGTVEIVEQITYAKKIEDITKHRTLRINGIDKAAQSYNDGKLYNEPIGVFFKGSPIAELLYDIKPHQIAFIGSDAGEISCLSKDALHQALTAPITNKKNKNKDSLLDRSLYIEFYSRYKMLSDIAKDSFSYIKTCAPDHRFFNGDTRYNLQASDTTNFDIIIISDFTTHAMPTELLTKEAFQLYKSKLAPQGVLAINRMDDFININSAVFAAVESEDLFIVNNFAAANDSGHIDSDWILIGRKNSIKDEPYWKTKGWSDIPVYKKLKNIYWTDKKANLFANIAPFGNPIIDLKNKPTK